MNPAFRGALGVVLAATLLTGCAPLLVGGAAGGAAIAHDRRSFNAMMDDQGVEMNVLGYVLDHDSLLQQTHVNVTSYNHVVLLTGEVSQQAQAVQITDYAKGLKQSSRVYNELAVMPESSLISRSRDSFLTAKVKAKLFEIRTLPGFDPTRVKVVTERQIVYLMGLVSHAEADAATDVVRRVGGVAKVVRLFEYTD